MSLRSIYSVLFTLLVLGLAGANFNWCESPTVQCSGASSSSLFDAPDRPLQTGITTPVILMDLTLKLVANETISGPSEPCVLRGEGIGIYNPTAGARSYAVVAKTMYDIWARFSPRAMPVTTYLGWHRASCQLPCNTTACSLEECAQTERDLEQALVVGAGRMMRFLLPEGFERAELAASLSSRFSLDPSLLQNVTIGELITKIQQNDPSFNNSHIWHALSAARAEIRFFENDGFNQLNCYADTTAFFPVNDPFPIDHETFSKCRAVMKWAPIMSPSIPHPQPFATPHAGYARGFSLVNGFEAVCPQPPETFRSLNMTMSDLVFNWTSRLYEQNGKNRLIAEFWSTGPAGMLPPGHTVSIALEVARRKCYNVENAIKLIFLAANAVNDAGIAAWAAKRTYQAARPITFIREVYENTTLPNQWTAPYCPQREILGKQWHPRQPDVALTPPFPEHPSGHSTFSRTAMEVVSAYVGSEQFPGGGFCKVILAGSSVIEPFCTRDNRTLALSLDRLPIKCKFTECEFDPRFNSENNFLPKSDVVIGPFKTFREIADSAGESRLYGGVHVPTGMLGGRVLATRVAAKVIKTAEIYFRESARETI